MRFLLILCRAGVHGWKEDLTNMCDWHIIYLTRELLVSVHLTAGKIKSYEK